MHLLHNSALLQTVSAVFNMIDGLPLERRKYRATGVVWEAKLVYLLTLEPDSRNCQILSHPCTRPVTTRLVLFTATPRYYFTALFARELPLTA